MNVVGLNWFIKATLLMLIGTAMTNRLEKDLSALLQLQWGDSEMSVKVQPTGLISTAVSQWTEM